MNDVLAYFPANYCIHYAISIPDFFPDNFLLMAGLCIGFLALGAAAFQAFIKKAKKLILWY